MLLLNEWLETIEVVLDDEYLQFADDWHYYVVRMDNGEILFWGDKSECDRFMNPLGSYAWLYLN